MVKTFAVTITLSNDEDVEAIVEVLFDAWKDNNGYKDIWDWHVLNCEVWIEGTNTLLNIYEKERLDKIIENKMKSVDFKEHYSEISIA